jgi:murein L,D-transpeptidase YcbB/YkuD
MDEDYLVLVNIAAFKAAIIRDGQTIWTMKVIVGGKDNETPELRSELKSVVFNPTWSVPRSIATEEMLPDIKQDPDFFAKGGYELYGREGNRVDPALVDWSTFSKNNFPFRLVQQPGPRNQLGQIKFMIPNRYSVCMHDTPSRPLFASTNRALSHGCIRIDDPLAFAELVLRDEGWTRDEIDAQIESGNTKSIALAKPPPVYVFYMTTEVDDLGKIYFYNDVYGRDASVLKALDAQAVHSTGQPVRRRQ